MSEETGTGFTEGVRDNTIRHKPETREGEMDGWMGSWGRYRAFALPVLKQTLVFQPGSRKSQKESYTNVKVKTFFVK